MLEISQCQLEAEFQGDSVIHRGTDGTAEQWMYVKDVGKGASGQVTLYEEARSHRLRAVKRIMVSYFSDKLEKERKKTESRHSFQYTLVKRELTHLISMRDCDQFVKLFGWYEDEDFVYIAMEYCVGGSLGEYIKTFGAQRDEVAAGIARQILQGIAVLHNKQICHRDLKPGNILIETISPMRVKIADLGISKSTSGTNPRTQCGTQGYAAPELQGFRPKKSSLPGNDYSPAVDIWGLGCLVHEILTSEVPFSGVESYTEISGLDWNPERTFQMKQLAEYCWGKIPFPVGSLQNLQVSERGVDFVKSLLAVDPDSRPSASEALNNVWLSDV